MAVLQMERIHICAMKRDRKKILELVQRRGTVEVSDASTADEIFTKADTGTARGLLEKNAATAAEAIELLKKYAPVKSAGLAFLNGREAVSLADNDAFYAKREEILRVSQRILHLERQMTEAKAEVLRAEMQQEALSPWLNLPVAQTFTGTKKTAVFIGSLEGEVELGEILAKLAEAAPELTTMHLELVSKTAAITTFYVITLKKDATLAEEALRTIGFARPASAGNRIPAKQKVRLQEKREKALAEIEAAKTEIETYGGRRDDIRFLHDHMKMRGEKYEVIENLAQSKHVFVMNGYIPANAAQTLQNELSGAFTCAVDILPVEEADIPPILLKNNAYVEPMEPVLESYSLPAKGEIDPCSAMSIFYYALFGLMFSDFGYGLVMAMVCGIILLKFKNMEGNWRKNVKLFFGCGIATMFWGVIFSSYFGDVFDAVARQFFGRAAGAPPVVPPVWFAPLQEPMSLLMFCLLLGIIHLTTGYIMKAANCVKNKQYLDLVYDAVLPVVMLFPLVLILMGSDMFKGMAGFKLDLPASLTPVCLGISGVCMVGIVLTSGRESKNWGKRLLKGAYGLYNALAGWLSDILSYSRLLALGLATGVIGSVVNQLGGMFGSGIVGVIGFVLVFCFGHALNFGINVLGAYVHSNRLEYVEFFGKFYEGGGRKFNPFGIHTKYYKIEEETQNGTF